MDMPGSRGLRLKSTDSSALLSSLQRNHEGYSTLRLSSLEVKEKRKTFSAELLRL
jgi:hypothetical protein